MQKLVQIRNTTSKDHLSNRKYSTQKRFCFTSLMSLFVEFIIDQASSHKNKAQTNITVDEVNVRHHKFHAFQ